MRAAEASKRDVADEKPPVDLVATDFLLGVARVLAYGAAKYDRWNWAKGKAWSRDYAAAMRHMLAWYSGEDLDPESGLNHLLHAACDLMIVYVSQRRGLGTDDRHKWEVK